MTQVWKGKIYIRYILFNVWSSGFPGGAVVRLYLPVQEMAETSIRALGQKGPLEKEMATHCSILA